MADPVADEIPGTVLISCTALVLELVTVLAQDLVADAALVLESVAVPRPCLLAIRRPVAKTARSAPVAYLGLRSVVSSDHGSAVAADD